MAATVSRNARRRRWRWGLRSASLGLLLLGLMLAVGGSDLVPEWLIAEPVRFWASFAMMAAGSMGLHLVPLLLPDIVETAEVDNSSLELF